MKSSKAQSDSMPSSSPAPRQRARLAVSPTPIVLGVLGTALFFLAWEIVARLGILNRALLMPPTDLLATVYNLVVSGELFRHLGASVWRALLGFVSGSVAGILIGIATARVSTFRHLSDPLLQMFRAIPSIAFVPLAIFWFGIGEFSKIFLIAWGVFFPVWVNTFLGVRDCNPLLLRAASTLGAGGWRMLWSVVLPAALPMILAGLRISLAVAFVLLVAAELAGAMAGVGYFIQLSAQVFRVDQMFVGLLTLGFLGFLADFFFVAITRRLFPWYGAEGRAARR
jgi:NitT/TauT family transport system permease protein/sulfonate transport system permease protein